MKIKYTFLFLLFVLICFKTHAQLDSSLAPFYYGVASGDPTATKVTLWTHVTPTNPFATSVKVTWRMATDTGFTNIILQGTAYARSNNDFTVKVNVSGLTANKWYYYQFFAQNKYSLTGRTHTLPSGNATDSVRMAVFSCSNYQTGYFNAYEAVANRNDVDVLLHLGDFIYEYAVGEFGYDSLVNKPHSPATEIISLSEYRQRHAQYKSDPQSIKLLQQYPLIAIWDDHEVANDAYKDGAENHQPLTEGDWNTRVSNGKRAYFDWMPVRKPDPTGDSLRLYRKFNFGNLISLDMLDTRLQGRTIQMATSDPNYNDTSRTMLGIKQRQWLFNGFNNSTAKWNIIGQQVMMAPLTVFGSVLNDDQWDGYPADRNRFYTAMQQNNQKNFVILTGDIHSSWANDLPVSGYGIFNRNASAGVEFTTPSVTSPNPFSSISPGLVQLFNSHVRYVDLSYNGFMIVDVNKNRIQSDYFALSTIKSNNYTTSWQDGWYVNNNEKFLRHAGSASVRAANKIKPLAPLKPMMAPKLTEELISASISNVKVYPNPTDEMVTLEFSSQGTNEISIHIFDLTGQEVLYKNAGVFDDGGYQIFLNLGSLSGGVYMILINTGNEIVRTKVVKQ